MVLWVIYLLNNSDSGSGSTTSHTHSWSTGYESTHPHRQYRHCSSCGATEYTGGTQLVSSCTSCYPLGNLSLTRSFVRTGKSVTFYRNNVLNANSYTLTLYRNGSFYNSYNMNSATYNIPNLLSGTYTATLTVRNNNTGQSKSVSCYSFTLVDTYLVTYNANGGTNAPPAQTKIQDEYMTITSSVPKKEGHIFKGWASSKTAVEAQYPAGGIYTKNTPITLYAVWEPETYTINFDLNGGKGEAESTTITYGNSMKMPNAVIKEGYYLKGWSKTKNAVTPDYKIGIDYKLTENMTLYAVWGNSTWGGAVSKGFAGGDGSEKNPYQISNASELAYLADKVNQQTSAPKYEYYILTDNINLGYEEWVPIGVYDSAYQYFCGSFDGNGYTISDLSITEENSGYMGIFGYTKDSNIKNINVSGDISGIHISSASYMGALLGYGDNTDITLCSAIYVSISDISNSTNDYTHIGAICGKIDGGSISNSTADECYMGVKGGLYRAGIIVGEAIGSISDCSVKSTEELFGCTTETKGLILGGICGRVVGDVQKCTVSAGFLSNTLKTNSISADFVGGIVGALEGNIDLCTTQFNNGLNKNIDGSSYNSSIYFEGMGSSLNVGGIAGRVFKNGKISNCKYDGQSISTVATGIINLGGIAGRVDGNSMTNIKAQGGQSLSRADLPTRSGYTATWYTDAELKHEYDFSQPVTSDMTLYAKWSKGSNEIEIWDGTSSEPAYNGTTKTYTVKNGRELAWISDVTNGVITSGTNFPTDTSFSGYTVELANDIYLNDISNVSNWATQAPANEWKPIGSENYKDVKFSGTFDGKNHTISGIYVNEPANSYAGLFGYSTSTIKNVVSTNGYIDGISSTGAIVGHSDGAITNCINKSVTVVGKGGVGGVVGGCDNISYCYNYASVTGTNSYVGGIAGYCDGNITHCLNKGSVTTKGWYCGGIAGRVETISYCYNAGYIKGDECCGGICGAYASNISKCYNQSSVSASTRHAGGIIGLFSATNENKIEYCYNRGSVSDESGGGGILGTWTAGGDSHAHMNYCYYNNSCAWRGVTTTPYLVLTSVSYKSLPQLKNLSNLTGFSSSDWGVNSSINDGYPYLKALEDTYKTYNITVVEDVENSSPLNKCFANVDGILHGDAGLSYVGGIAGYAGESDDAGSAPAGNLLAIATRVSAVSANSTGEARAGDILGLLYNNALDLSNIYSYSSTEYSAINSANSKNASTSVTGTQRNLPNIKRASFLKTLFGPDTYQSLDYLDDHPDAVWVVKDGELPELYYNVLNDITLSDVENGTLSADKTQAVDGEIVTVTAVPDKNYNLNKIYVNGNEIAGNTFEVSGDSNIYATFSEKTPEYNIRVSATGNAQASLINIDAAEGVSISAVSDNISAFDGDEICVNAEASANYTVDSVRVNGEELAGNSFIVTDNSVVTMDVTNISTEIKATTYDAENIGNYFATLSGSVEGDSTTEKYIRYWAANTPDEVYTTEVQSGSGEYSVEVTNLLPETEYQYQMTETGEIKTFVTEGISMSDIDSGIDDPDSDPTSSPTPTPTPTPSPEPTDMFFEIKDAKILGNQITANIRNISENVQSGILILAAYANNGMLIYTDNVQIKDLNVNTVIPCEFVLPKNAVKYRLFVWNSYDLLIPMSEVTEIK